MKGVVRGNPKRKHQITPAEPRRRFEAEVEKLRKADELDPDEAEAALDEMVRKSVRDHGA
jgi:hypothetical protein